jgi:hypothetical protein
MFLQIGTIKTAYGFVNIRPSQVGCIPCTINDYIQGNKLWLPVKMIALGGMLLVRKTHPTMLPCLYRGRANRPTNLFVVRMPSPRDIRQWPLTCPPVIAKHPFLNQIL